MKHRPTGRPSSEKIIRDIKRKTRKQYSAEEKICMVLDGLRGEDSIAQLCRREGIAQGLYYKWSRDFLTPADVYFGRGQSILAKRERIKPKTIAKRRLHYQRHAA